MKTIKTDLAGFKFTEVGKEVTYLAKKMKNSCEYNGCKFYNSNSMYILFEFGNFSTLQSSTENVFSIEDHFFISISDVNNISSSFSFYVVNNLYGIYQTLNYVNKKYDLTNKNHLNLYDIRDFFEEILLINA